MTTMELLKIRRELNERCVPLEGRILKIKKTFSAPLALRREEEWKFGFAIYVVADDSFPEDYRIEHR